MNNNLETSLPGMESEVEKVNFGDRIEDVDKTNGIRIAVQNVRGLGKTRRGTKNQEWEKLTKEYKIDCFCFGEVNVDWRKVKDQDRIPNRIRGWWETACTSFANNVTEDALQAEQYGGRRNTLSPSGLARMAWT